MDTFFESPVGILRITEDDSFIVSVSVVSEAGQSEETPLLIEAVKQLKEYFRGERKDFDLPLRQSGTEFQQRAWSYLSSIPYGKTVSYKDEAIGIGSPKGCRAVGAANGKNNICILVPCHRVVNEGGGLGGYAYGLEMKEFLLNLEKIYSA